MEKVCFFTFFTCFTKCLHMGMYAFAHTLESVLSRFTSLKEYISRILYAQYAGKLPECSFYATAPSSNIKGFTHLPHIVYHSYDLVAKRVLINMVIAGISPI